jgi:hypothetical protein
VSPIFPDQPELILTESRTMRAATVARTEVLDKVKVVSTLSDDIHVTTELVATYFEVDVETIKKLVQRHRPEFTENGLHVLRGTELQEFERDTLSPSKRRALTLFTRRTMLNVGQLLTGSDIAKQIRTYLLDVEEEATPEQKATAIEKAAEAEAQLRAVEVLSRIDGNTSYARSLSRHIAARMLGQEPELDPADITITADEYLTEKGVAPEDLPSARTRLGRTVAALYRARYSKDPQKIRRPIHGVHREVAVYTHRDIDLFDTAWVEVGRHYDLQGSIELGGAA